MKLRSRESGNAWEAGGENGSKSGSLERVSEGKKAWKRKQTYGGEVKKESELYVCVCVRESD